MLLSWWAVEIQDPELRSQMRMHLHACMLDRKGSRGRNHEVNWDTLSVLDTGFAIKMVKPVQWRPARLWWYHRLGKVLRDKAKEVRWSMSGSAEVPPGARPILDEYPTQFRSSSSTGASSQPSGLLAAISDGVIMSWPRYPARRLAGGCTDEMGVGGTPAAYSGGSYIGQGSFGTVHKVTLGGEHLAVKAFASDLDGAAWQEACIAEHVRGHPHVVHLLDACLRPADLVSLLVYRHAGVSLRAAFDGVGIVPPASVQAVGIQVASGMAHLHSLGLYHSDLKPENIIVDRLGQTPLRAVVADLGGVVEVALGNITLRQARTTIWYRAPELLSVQQTALGSIWLKADVWALGIVLCFLTGHDFFMVDVRDLSPSRERVAMSTALSTVFPGHLDPLVDPVMTVSAEVRQRHGPSFADCLQAMLTWTARDRPGAIACLQQPWMAVNVMKYPPGHGAALLPGDRHPWALVSGAMSVEVLTWLQQDVQDIKALRTASTQKEGVDGLKTVLSGKLIDSPGSLSLNALKIDEMLPCARLVAWLRAWKECNAASLAQMIMQATAGLRGLSEGGKGHGKNRDHFLSTPMTTWCLVAGQVHIFREPGALEEPCHHDGGASVLHMGVTLYGRRRVRCFTQDQHGEFEDFEQVPGSVYLGTLTGPLHEVHHDLPHSHTETCLGHSVSIMIRTSLFPHNRQRAMNRPPDDILRSLAQTFSEALRDLPWRMPGLAMCLRAVTPEV